MEKTRYYSSRNPSNTISIISSSPSPPCPVSLDDGVDYIEKGKSCMELRFSHRLRCSDAVTFFAFCVPFSYEELQQQLDAIMQKHHHHSPLHSQSANDIYVHRELLGYSIGGRRLVSHPSPPHLHLHLHHRHHLHPAIGHADDFFTSAH